MRPVLPTVGKLNASSASSTWEYIQILQVAAEHRCIRAPTFSCMFGNWHRRSPTRPQFLPVLWITPEKVGQTFERGTKRVKRRKNFRIISGGRKSSLLQGHKEGDDSALDTKRLVRRRPMHLREDIRVQIREMNRVIIFHLSRSFHEFGHVLSAHAATGFILVRVVEDPVRACIYSRFGYSGTRAIQRVPGQASG